MAEHVLPAALGETVRVVGTRVPLWEWHAKRLESGFCPPEIVEDARRGVDRAVQAGIEEGAVPTKVKIAVGVGGGVVTRWDVDPSSLEVEGGPRIAPIAVDAPPSLPPNAAKPADRTFWALAQGRARSLEVEQAVLIDRTGYVVDGSTASVWAVFGTRLMTPPSPPAIHGVGRMVIEELAPRLGFTVEARPFDYDELVRADEAMLSNATGGAVAVRHRGGPVSAALAHEFRLLYGAAEDQERGDTD